jgi:hypothetical protein
MSLAKSVSDGLKPQECERTKLREQMPVPDIPKKDKVQEEVTRLRNLQITRKRGHFKDYDKAQKAHDEA